MVNSDRLITMYVILEDYVILCLIVYKFKSSPWNVQGEHSQGAKTVDWQLEGVMDCMLNLVLV